MKLDVIKKFANAKSPGYGSAQAAGLDIYTTDLSDDVFNGPEHNQYVSNIFSLISGLKHKYLMYLTESDDKMSVFELWCVYNFLLNAGVENLNNITAKNLSAFDADMTKHTAFMREVRGRENAVVIRPGERFVFDTGIAFKFPEGVSGLMVNKSGVAVKKGLVMTCALVDEDYTGTVNIGVANTSKFACTIGLGQKLAQMILINTNHAELVIDGTPVGDTKAKRADGKFGSTGLK